MVCKTCKIDKPEDDFGKYKIRGSVKRRLECKGCRVLKQADYQKTPEAKDKARRRRIFRDYGITAEQYDRLSELQDHCCAICFCPFSELPSRPHIDHAHSGNRRVRGLLCFDCNSGIGKFRDSETLLQNAIEYIRSSYNSDAVWLAEHINKRMEIG